MLYFFSRNKKEDDFSDTASMLTIEPDEESTFGLTQSQTIDEQIEVERRMRPWHILILGAPASGKSTLLNQMKIVGGEAPDIRTQGYTPTIGIAEADIEIRETPFKFTEIGGSYAVPKNWMSVFDQSQTLFYVVDLSTYDLMIHNEATGEKENAVKFYMGQLNNLADNYKLSARFFVVIFNKMDLFREKIRSVPLTVCFEDFEATSDVDSCAKYIEDRFREILDRGYKKKWLYCRRMDGPQPVDVSEWIAFLLHIVLTQHMDSVGLLL